MCGMRHIEVRELTKTFLVPEREGGLRAAMRSLVWRRYREVHAVKGIDLSIEAGEIVYKATKPDLTDNLNKGVFDALQGIIYANDSQIISMDNVKKIYGLLPRVEIELEIL